MHRDSHLPARTRRVLHVDVDAFLASVEQALHPELRGKPVVVGGPPDSRNLVMSCSREARAFGIRAGMRAAEAARLCRRAIFRAGDSRAANAKRDEVARVLLDISPRVEVASLDDFYVDLSGSARLLGAACDVAARLRMDVRRRTHLPVTVGVGTSKLTARLAGKLGKPGGVAELLPGHERAFLARMPVEHLPGVGYTTQRRLAAFAIRTAGDLALVSREVLFATFGPLGLTLAERARGIDAEPVRTTVTLTDDGALVHAPPKSIRRTSTFEPEEGRRAHVEAMLAYIVDRAAARLREHGLAAGSLEVGLEYVDTRATHERARAPLAPGRHKARRRLPSASDETAELGELARHLLRGLPRRRALVKRVSVALLALRPAGGRQGRLFSDPETERGLPAAAGALDAVVDSVRARHGFGRIVRGASLPLAADHPLGPDGFRLRTPSLNQ